MHANPRRLVFLFALCPLAAQAPRLAPQSAESVLPASTYAAVRFGGLTACRDATEKTPLAQAVTTFLQKVPAEVRAEHLDQGLEQAVQHVQATCEHIGLRPADVRGALGRPMLLAVGRLSIEGMGPSVALVIETGDQKKAVNRLVQWGSQRIAEMAGGAQTDELEIGGHRFHSMQVKEGPSLFAGSLGEFYVITNSRGYLLEMIDVAAGKQPPLGTSTRLGQLSGGLPAPALASLFVNADRVTSAFAPHLPYEAAEWSAALGLGAVDAVYWATTATPQGGVDMFHVGVGGSEKGLLKALLAAPADLSFANACSANTVLFGAGSLDVEGVITAFHKFAELLPEAWREQMMKELQRDVGRELRHAGTSAEHVHGIVKAFGTQIGVALALEKGAVPKPELLVRLAVRDADAVRGMLQHLEAAAVQNAGLEWKTRKVGEHEVRFCSLQMDQVQLQLSPSYVLTKDALWVSSDTAALVRALRQDAAGSLASQPDFQDLAQHAAGASGLVHWRLFRAAELGWRSVETLVYPLLDSHKEEVGFGSEALPDAETMAKVLGTCTSIYRVDDDGFTMQTRGTFTLGAMLAAFGTLGDEVLARASGKVY